MSKRHDGKYSIRSVLKALSEGNLERALKIVASLRENCDNAQDEGLIFLAEGLINSYKVAKGKSKYASSVAFIGDDHRQLVHMLRKLEKVLKVAGLEFDLSTVHNLTLLLNNNRSVKLMEKAFSFK